MRTEKRAILVPFSGIELLREHSFMKNMTEVVPVALQKGEKTLGNL